MAEGFQNYGDFLHMILEVLQSDVKQPFRCCPIGCTMLRDNDDIEGDYGDANNE